MSEEILQEKKRIPKYNNFIVVIYPDEDKNHKKFFDYIKLRESQGRYEYFYIVHDKDVDPDTGELKKSHVHMLIHQKEFQPLTSFLNYFKYWIDYAEGVSSVSSCLSYFLHDTPDCIEHGKTPYSLEDLKGTHKFISKYISQKDNFVQFREFANMCKDGYMLSDIITRICDESNEQMYHFFRDNQFIIVSMNNQELNFRSREFSSNINNLSIKNKKS